MCCKNKAKRHQKWCFSVAAVGFLPPENNGKAHQPWHLVLKTAFFRAF